MQLCIRSVYALLAIFCAFPFAHLGDFVMRVLSDIGPCSCKRECYSSSGCASVNYDSNSFVCELNSYHGSSFNQSNASMFYHFFSLDDIKQEFSDPCYGILCGPNMKCINSTNGIFCIVTVCDTVPSIPNGAVGLGYDYLNAVRNITCNIGFVMSTSNNSITCQENGQWSDINITCNHVCPDSFHHDTTKDLCIRVFDVPATWDEADNVCKNYSQRLININTPSQVTILTDYLQSLATVDEKDDLHVGGRLVDGQYRWVVTNEAIDPSVWAENSPSGARECTLLHDTQKLKDKECTHSTKYVCGAFY